MTATGLLRGCLRLAPLSIALVACGARKEPETLQSALDRQLVENAERHGIAGQAALVLRDGEVVYRGAQGLADRETGRPVRVDDVFPVYSVSKLFASVLVMQLVERGELDLGQPIGRYLPHLPRRWRAITVDELLNHGSGLPEYIDTRDITKTVFLPTTEAVFARLADEPMLFAAGTDTRYTQTNFLLVGAILEAHYGRPYRQIVIDRIVKPLGLGKTYLGKGHVPREAVIASYRGVEGELAPDLGVDWPEYGIVHAELYSTVDDLAAFLIAVSRGRLVRRDTLLRLWRPHRRRDGVTVDIAAGWEHETEGRFHYLGHDGGTKVRVRFVFADSLDRGTSAFIYLTNGSARNVWSRTLVDSLMEVTARHELARDLLN